MVTTAAAASREVTCVRALSKDRRSVRQSYDLVSPKWAPPNDSNPMVSRTQLLDVPPPGRNYLEVMDSLAEMHGLPGSRLMQAEYKHLMNGVGACHSHLLQLTTATAKEWVLSKSDGGIEHLLVDEAHVTGEWDRRLRKPRGQDNGALRRYCLHDSRAEGTTTASKSCSAKFTLSGRAGGRPLLNAGGTALSVPP